MFAISLMTADIAQSCPAYLKASLLPNWVTNTSPEELGIFTVNPARTWEELPLQLDPMTSDGLFDATRKSTKEKSKIQSNDRLVFYTEKFGLPVATNMAFPCKASQLAEIRTPSNTFAYVAKCSSSSKPSQSLAKPVVSLETKNRLISSENFHYIYHPRNQLLYESLLTKSPSGELARSAYESDVGIRLDLKKFFNLHFNNDDIESYVTSSKIGPLGVVQGVAFYLRLFAFKIDLKMNTVASFFESGANIPMVIDVPADAHAHLNPGSGSLYSLKLDKAEFDMDHPLSSMPRFEGKLLKSGSSGVKKAGLRRCKGNQCNYKMMGKVNDQPFALSMTVDREVVEMGFFPSFIYDVKEFKTDMEWKGTNLSTANERAIFFPTHGLSKGKYKIDSWILLGDASTSTSSCPAPVEVGPSLTNSTKPKIAH
jgi:hypothetical protein